MKNYTDLFRVCQSAFLRSPTKYQKDGI